MKKLQYLSIFLFLVTGCAAPPYIDNSININDQNGFSVVTTDSDTDHTILQGLNEIVSFTEVDGKSVKGFFQSMGPQEITVPPGKHTFRVRFSWLNTVASGCLELTTVAGTNYIVRKQPSRNTVQFWLETTDGKVVGNLCGFVQDYNHNNSSNQDAENGASS